MSLSFFDLHCDTAGEMLRQGQPLAQNSLAVSLQKAQALEQYIQVMAFWTDSHSDNEAGWATLRQMQHNLQADPAVKAGEAKLCTACPPREAGVHLLMALEDARVLNGVLSRVDAIAEMGIRILTPLWWGESCMGGAHDTSVGLTSFGKQAIRRACTLGILPDISHASRQAADDIFDLAAEAGAPVIASHSNAYEICPVSRNLHPDQIESILQSGGIIGINLYTEFLAHTHAASREDVRRHIEYFAERGAAHALCFGCDMDGAELPPDIGDLAAMERLADYLSGYYSDGFIQALFFENAYQFAERQLLPTAKNP